MARALTAFSVSIVATAETAIKAVIARESIYEWNAAHAWSEGRAFLPLAWADDEASAAPGDADLLIAFVLAQGMKAATPSAVESNVARQTQAGRPAFIYVSEARADLGAPGNRVAADLRCARPNEATIDSFKDEKELRSKLAQRLQELVRYHPKFQVRGEISVPLVAAEPVAKALQLSEAAQTLIVAACDDPEAYVARMKVGGGIKVQVNGRQYIKAGDPASAALWDGAFQELLQAGLLRDVGCNGQLFQISGPGFRFLETIGKSPVGYIEELGGM